MPAKLQLYSQLANYTAQQITGSFQAWTAFLTTAGRLYKYPFPEQLLIYAQRPDATACAEYDTWKKQVGRYAQYIYTQMWCRMAEGQTAPHFCYPAFTAWKAAFTA